MPRGQQPNPIFLAGDVINLESELDDQTGGTGLLHFPDHGVVWSSDRTACASLSKFILLHGGMIDKADLRKTNPQRLRAYHAVDPTHGGKAACAI